MQKPYSTRLPPKLLGDMKKAAETEGLTVSAWLKVVIYAAIEKYNFNKKT